MKTKVRIYKPSKTTTQSGRGGRSEDWLVEGVALTSRTPEHLMGWVSAEDTNDQIRMRFETKDTAIAFAEEKGWTYEVEDHNERRVHPQSYFGNFEYRTVEYDAKTTGSHAAIADKAKSRSSKRTGK